MKNLHRNGEGYTDNTAGDAIREADRTPEQIAWFIRTIKDLAAVFDLEIKGRVAIKDKKTGREYR